MVFKLIKETLFEQTDNFMWLSVFVFAGYNQSLRQEINLILFWILKGPVKLASIYNLQPLNVKWYCNHDRGSEGLLYHLHCSTLGNTLQCQQ